MSATRNSFALISSLALAAAAVAQTPPPNYDFDWVSVSARGNRPANQAEAPELFPPYTSPALLVGAVGHDYRITRTEVTAGQWLEFVNAYWPYYQGSYTNPELTGHWILPTTLPPPGQDPHFYVLPGAANHPTDTSWRMAARYVNWLSNGKVSAPWAFETGAYDTSTFTQNPDGSVNDQPFHSLGAGFWIPTLDEWTKAMYYDPNRNGTGQGGYWTYPTTSDTAPIPGWPWEGGQTSAGITPFSGPYLDVGSYPSVTSPWGLLDGSGSQSEWTEFLSSDNRVRGIKGSHQFGPMPELYDRIDWIDGSFPFTPIAGFRIASQIPAPGETLSGIALLWIAHRRRR